jgi:hypothetical protein
MMNRRRLALVAVAVAVAISAAAGVALYARDEAVYYTAEKTSPCLKAQKFKIFPQKVPPAQAKKINLVSLLGLNEPGHYLAFYTTEEVAKKAHLEFVRNAGETGRAGTDTVQQQGNVMLVLPMESRTMDATILDCLQ